MVVCEEDTTQAQTMLDEMNSALINIGIRISPKKTKAMLVNEDYVDEHDSFEGHNDRVDNLGCSAFGPRGRPWAQYVAVIGPREKTQKLEPSCEMIFLETFLEIDKEEQPYQRGSCLTSFSLFLFYAKNSKRILSMASIDHDG